MSIRPAIRRRALLASLALALAAFAGLPTHVVRRCSGCSRRFGSGDVVFAQALLLLLLPIAINQTWVWKSIDIASISPRNDATSLRNFSNSSATMSR